MKTIRELNVGVTIVLRQVFLGILNDSEVIGLSSLRLLFRSMRRSQHGSAFLRPEKPPSVSLIPGDCGRIQVSWVGAVSSFIQ